MLGGEGHFRAEKSDIAPGPKNVAGIAEEYTFQLLDGGSDDSATEHNLPAEKIYVLGQDKSEDLDETWREALNLENQGVTVRMGPAFARLPDRRTVPRRQ